MHNEDSRNGSEFSRKYIAHYGLRTRQLPVMIEWYKKFFDAEVLYDAGFGVFISFDDDHHRLVIWTDDETAEKVPNSAGMDHIGVWLPDFRSLVENYERLKSLGIMPVLPVNHRFSTSLYYHDPDGNEVEYSVDNFPTKRMCQEFVSSERMGDIMQPPFGDVFDPEELVQMFRAGASNEEMARIGSVNAG